MNDLILSGLAQIRPISIAIALGVVLRTSLVIAGQRWAKSYSNTVTYMLLPAVGLVIVDVISNNIALSLGMIGALSIVRFRHPVKSPLELVVYFLLLTVGIALTTRPLGAIFLAGVSSLVIVCVSWFSQWRGRHGGTTFPLLPEHGDQVYILEVTANEGVPLLAESNDVLFAHEDRTANSYTYKLAFSQRAQLDAWRTRLAKIESIDQVTSFYQ